MISFYRNVIRACYKYNVDPVYAFNRAIEKYGKKGKTDYGTHQYSEGVQQAIKEWEERNAKL
jgi:hypothetical protein